MSSIVCTLFEGSYHYGVGALVNSLCRLGFQGEIVAGYRGALPDWAGDGERLEIDSGCTLRFIRLEVEAHFANYKPMFMLELLDRHYPEAESIYYFDPDIVVKCRWSFFEDWVLGGVALCEDVNSPVPSSHPLRHAWRRFFEPRGMPLPRAMEMYINAGFIGLRRTERALLERWLWMLEQLREVIPHEQFLSPSPLWNFPFCNYDQDALNAAVMSAEVPLSLVGQDGMDFKPGGYIMSHAIGRSKPWNKRPLLAAARGIQPSMAEKTYLQFADGPIQLYRAQELFWRRIEMRMAAALGRVLKRAV